MRCKTVCFVVLSVAAILILAAAAAESYAQPLASLRPTVELEEEVYRFEPANNGAGPLWCNGSTCLVRIGEEVFASGLETLKGFKPLNNCRWTFWKRTADGWQLQQADRNGRTREPCPLAYFDGGPVFLSANPTLVTDPNAHSGPARPEVLQFDPADPKAPYQTLLPKWEGTPAFSEHSYRSFAADGPNRELIVLQNIGYTHAEWSFLDRSGAWSAAGKLVWPWGAEYRHPRAVRTCYPNVALKGRAVYFCGVSDIEEPNPEWQASKKQLTGRSWDYDFRRLFYTWTPDVTKTKFHPWVEIASREKTCGWIMPGDLWVAPDGVVHLLWLERAIDERLRAKFFPDAKQSHALQYAQVRDGKVVLRRALVESVEGRPGETASAGRFHVTPDNRLLVICYVAGVNAAGKHVAENRIMELAADGAIANQCSLPLKHPMTSYFTATIRAGSAPSTIIDMLGHRADAPGAISYARIRL
jgi:hypothetical protein